HLGALAADDDAGARGEDVHLELVRRALDLDGGHARVTQPLLQLAPQLQVLVEQLGVLLRRKPARAPRLVEADAESVRMDFLTHGYLRPVAAARAGAFTGTTSS